MARSEAPASAKAAGNGYPRAYRHRASRRLYTTTDSPTRPKGWAAASTKARVTAPFTVEAVPAPAVVSVDDVIAAGSTRIGR